MRLKCIKWKQLYAVDSYFFVSKRLWLLVLLIGYEFNVVVDCLSPIN